MSLRQLLTHTVTIKRLTPGEGVKKSFTEIATDVATLIQPLDPQAIEQLGSSFAADSRAWFMLGMDVKENDRLVDQDGRSFGVKGLRLRNYGPADMQHVEALLGRDRSQQ